MKNTPAGSFNWFYLYVFIVLSTVPTTIGAWNVSNITRFERDTCNELKEFQCVRNKKCINVDLRCDGKKDCPDGSDETTECKEFSCYGFLFTCDYGACIEMAKRCDGNRDCWDNSDEINCVVDNSDKPEGNCSSNNFECNSGQCIDLDGKCNGKEDCIDRSDETKETCLNEWCPGFLFKCNYGACIDSFRECNGVSDCADGSDEVNCPGLTPKPPTPPTKPTPPPTPDSGCILPPTPKHGRWKAPIPLGGSGSIIPSSTLLSLVCDSGYGVAGLNGANFIACIDTDWQSVIPTCEKLCPAQYSEKIMTVKCYSNDGSLKEIKCDQAVHNSFAKIECSKFYEFPNRPRLRNSITRFCYNGKWNLEFPECVPVCGERKVGQTLIVNGDKVERGNYPWVTAIFQVLEQEEIMNVCGGSMLTQNIIVTAAHCVTVDEDSGDLLDPSKIKVAVGKYFNKYKDPRDDKNAQYSDVKRIIKPSKYNGNIGSFQSDIALLVTKKKLNFSKYVQPVCYQEVTEVNLRLGDEGVVTGWGFTKDSKDPSDELKELIVPYKDDDTCRKELPPDFFRFSTLDKFCAGFYNKSVGVCKGDSGGGLVYKDQNGRYQIVGLVSIGNIINNKCNVQASAFYTDVKQHYVWLEENISKNTIDIKEPR